MRPPSRSRSIWLGLGVLLPMLLAAPLATGSPAEAPAPPEPASRELPPQVDARIEQLAKTINEHQRGGEFKRAEAAAREVAELRSEYQGRDHWQAQDARRDAETLRTIAGLPEDGRRALASAWALRDEFSAHWKRARYAEAERIARRLVDLDVLWLGEDHPATALSRNDLAVALQALDRNAEAEEQLRRALDTWLKTMGPDHPLTATGRSNLARTLRAQGKHAEAEEQYRRALAIHLATWGEDHPNTANSRNGLAVVLRALGKNGEAEAQLRRALATWLGTLGPDDPRTATARSNLAEVMSAQGKHAEAEEQLRRALATSLAALGAAHPDTAVILNNLGSTLRAQGKSAEAEAQHRGALAVRLAALGESHPRTAISRNNLAEVLADQGKSAEAEAQHRGALAVRLAALGESHPLTAASRNNLAGVLAAQGKHAEAEEQLRRALATSLAALGESHPDTATCRISLAGVLERRGRLDEAIAQWKLAAEALDRSRAWQGSSGLERALASGRSPRPALALALAHQGQHGEAWEWWEADLARGLLDDFSARQARPLTDEERKREADLLGGLQKIDESIGRLMARIDRSQDETKRLDGLRQEWSRRRGEFVEFQNGLDAKYQAFAGKPSPFAEVRAALPDGVALVGWIDSPFHHGACLVRPSGDPVWVEISGTGAEGTWTDEDDGRPAALREALAERRANWQDLARALARQRIEPLRPHLEDIRHLVVLPSSALAGLPIEALLAASPGKADRLVVSYAPSGSMFARLVRPRSADPGPPRLLALGDPAFPAPEDSGPEPAPPDHGIAIASVVKQGNADRNGLRAGDVLLEYDGRPIAGPDDLKVVPIGGKATSIPLKVWRRGKVRELTVAAGPLGSQFLPGRSAARVILAQRAAQDALAPLTRGDAWAPLPGTRREVEAIAALFPPGRVTTLLGDRATETAVQTMAGGGELKGYRFLHLATHGKADPTIAMNSSLILAPDPDRSASGTSTQSALETDGRITAEQIARTWDLDADLVVLSACQTGLGRYAGGEGYLGFSQALFVKGARSVVLSLWKVDDDATALLMARFYQNLLGRREGLAGPMPKAAALDEAKQWLRGLTAAEVDRTLASLNRGEVRHRPRPPIPASDHPFAPPRDWSAFILIGDPN